MIQERTHTGPTLARAAITAAILTVTAFGLSAIADPSHDHGGGRGGEGKEHGGGGHKGQGGKGGGGGGHGGGHGSGHGQATPGATDQKCREPGDMPPHYCEPAYKVVSSARGIGISAAAPAGDKAVMVTLRELDPMAPGVPHALVLVGGTGDLAGAMVIPGGWRQTQTVNFPFEGNDSIYNHKSMHLHLFPLTSQ
jgi:hypothetical protein